MRSLRTSAQPFLEMRPSLRLSALELSEGARPRQDAALRPDEGRERPPTSAEGASAEEKPTPLARTGATTGGPGPEALAIPSALAPGPS